MLNPLTLPALAALIAFPGFGLRKPAVAVPSDTLPPPWKTVSRLALESRFVTGRLPALVPVLGGGVRLKDDPRRLRVDFDPDSGVVAVAHELGEVELGQSARIPVTDYVRGMNRMTFDRVWRERSRTRLNTIQGAVAAAQRQTGFSFALPSPLPRRVQSWLGPGGPAINVSGSENISLSGTSNWTNQQMGLLGQKRSLFPSLDMQQNLDIRLEGQLSDRVKVNLLQNSANQIPLANRIAINYKGEEDDLVQSLDLGNTSLTLPGTQYVSYSGKNEGLFGAKVATRIGPLDFTVLASKQEGRSERASYGGGASRQQQTLYDADYLHDVYFLLYDPNLESLDIPDSSLKVYVDDANPYNDAVGTVPGRAYVDPRQRSAYPGDSAHVDGQFALKNPGDDYEILQVYGPYFKVLRMRQQLVDNQRLAVTFSARPAGDNGVYDPVGGGAVQDSMVMLKLLRAPKDVWKVDADGFFYDAANPFEAVRDLSLKNFYQLGGSRIDPGSFSLSIRRDVTQPYQTTIVRDGVPIPYIELLGLDNLDETSGTPAKGHDNAVDGTAIKDANSSTINVFLDYENGVLFFPDPRPFAPRITGPEARNFDQRVSALLNRRATLVGLRDSLDGANTHIYDHFPPDRGRDAQYYIDVDYTAAKAGGEIQLGRGNIIEGSDVVTINGAALARDRDYTIDYDLGRVVLKRQVGAADNLNIDYSYAPLFQQAGRTLLGSAFRFEGRDRTLGGAFLYESRGAQDLRPRLGEEPSRSLIGDLNTEWGFRPTFLTRLADRLPGVRTTAPSELRFQAEGGMSFPNPNTRNEVFIDDMESVRDAVTLSMDPARWHPGSVPSRLRSGLVSRLTDPSLAGDHDLGGKLMNAEAHWYLPPTGIKEKELKPTLTEAQGANNTHQALAISVPRRPTAARDRTLSPTDSLWVSLTYPLDAVGLDLTRSQFIELWVTDFNDYHTQVQRDRVRGRHVKLHVDLGRVSEDQMRAPDESPDDVLNTEDQNRDGQLSVTDRDNEDTGLDGVANGGETHALRDLVTANTGDPEGDDFGNPYDNYNDLDPRRFVRTNGTEGNKHLSPIPDTEDLNSNGILDGQEDYFEYTVDLSDTAQTYLVTDLQHPKSGPVLVGPENGWRRYRIPLDDVRRAKFGSPNLALAQHVRVWVEGIIDPDPDPNIDPLRTDDKGRPTIFPLLAIGGLDIVGSRWQTSLLPQRTIAKGTVLTLSAVNSVDDAADYLPLPFDPGDTRNGNQSLTRREQSLVVEFKNLGVGDTLEAYKSFSIDENYSRYGKLDWYVAGVDIPGYDPARDTLWYFVRFASDENGRNYYEYRAPVPASSRRGAIGWQRVSLTLTDLSNLKLKPGFPLIDPVLYRDSSGVVRYVIKGRPSFTRLRRISVGLIGGSSDTTRVWPEGQLWVDEFRGTDVAKDVGRAGRVSVSGNVANLLQYNGALNMRDADFLSVGETRGSGSSQNQLNLAGTFQPHRFFEGTGILLPMSYGYARSSTKPRFSAGDDVVRTGALADASESYAGTHTFGTSYSRAWSERSNPLLRYTVGGLTGNFSRAWTNTHNPTSVGRRTSLSETVNWDIAPRQALVLAVPGSKLRFYPLPERLYWHFNLQSSRDSTWDRSRSDPDSLLLRSVNRGSSRSVQFGGDSRPFDLLHHHFEGTRNLSLPENLLQNGGRLFGLNVGRVMTWAQGLDASYTLQRGAWLRPRLNWSSSYSQNNGIELSRDLGVRAVGNSQGARLSWELPFDALSVRPPSTSATARRDTAAVAGTDSSRAGRGAASRPRIGISIPRLLSRLGRLSVEGSVTKNSSFSRLVGTPDMPYLLGLSDDPGLGGSVQPLFDNQRSRSLNRSLNARSRVDVGLGASLQSRAEAADRQGENNAVRSASTTLRFPDFEVDYGRIPTVIRLDRVIRNARLRTALSRVQSWDRLGGALTSAHDGWEMRPVFGLSGDFKNGTRTEFKVDRRTSTRRSYQLGESETHERSTSISLNLNRSYTQGQKVNLLGRENTVRTSVSLGLSGTYDKTTGDTRRRRGSVWGRPQFARDEVRLSVRGTGSYGFASNVTGNAALGFLQTNDNQRDIVRRSITVELRAAFNF